MSKKLNQWERNRINIENAQRRAQVLISQLESQGAEVRSDLKNLATKALTKSRYTKKEAKAIMGLLQSSRIKAAAKKTVTMMEYIKYPSISGPRPAEKVSVRLGKEGYDLSKKFLSSMKYSLRYHPSTDVAKVAYQVLNKLGYKTKIGTELKKLQSIDSTEFQKRFSEFYNNNQSDANILMNLYYSLGKSSPAAVKAKQLIDVGQAKRTFGMNSQLGAHAVDSLFDFFNNSKVWDKFRKSNRPSDEYDVYDNLETLSNLLSDGSVSISDVDNMLLSTSDFGTAIEKLLNSIVKSN